MSRKFTRRLYAPRSLKRRFKWRFGILFIVMGLLYLAINSGRPSSFQTTAPNNTGHSVQTASSETIICDNPYVVDGDTLHCDGHKIRLASIDAPEISPCKPGRRCVRGDGNASKRYLQSLINGQVRCKVKDIDTYGRKVSYCTSGGNDLSCAMVKSGHAVERYGHLDCR